MSELEKARAMAANARTQGAPSTWFEALYAQAAAGQASIPWEDNRPHPLLVRWLDRHAISPGRALDIGCGLGDNGAELARRGYDVDAFDVAPSAIELARQRWAALPALQLRTADLFAPPAEWSEAFDLVVEIYTLQALPSEVRAAASAHVRSFVRPGGRLLVITHGREEHEPEGALPWPLTRAQVEALQTPTLQLTELEEVEGNEAGSLRFVATFQRS